MGNFRSAPVKQKVDVSIIAATGSIAKFWDKDVRPTAKAGRTAYRWTSIVRYYPFLARTAFGWAAQCYSLAIFTPSQNNAPILTGLMSLVEGATFPGSTDKCVYVWFLQSAPDAYILSKGAALTPRSGEALLDAAMVASQKAGYDGRILLHADPSGGQGLIDYYANFGLTRLPNNVPVGIATKQNDGRYFVADSATASFLINRHNRYR